MRRAIIQFPNSLLKMPSNSVDVLNVPFADIQDLRTTFESFTGCIGLAAPQLGILRRIIIVDVTRCRSNTLVMLNPVIVRYSEDQQRVEDGCMSVEFGHKFIVTRRPKRITVSWFDVEEMSERTQKFSGLMAACVHHEIDHLNGTLMFDRQIAGNVR